VILCKYGCFKKKISELLPFLKNGDHQKNNAVDTFITRTLTIYLLSTPLGISLCKTKLVDDIYRSGLHKLKKGILSVNFQN
jgi:hypothetical protein